jgi:hypothetical protein
LNKCSILKVIIQIFYLPLILLALQKKSKKHQKIKQKIPLNLALNKSYSSIYQQIKIQKLELICVKSICRNVCEIEPGKILHQISRGKYPAQKLHQEIYHQFAYQILSISKCKLKMLANRVSRYKQICLMKCRNQIKRCIQFILQNILPTLPTIAPISSLSKCQILK